MTRDNDQNSGKPFWIYGINPINQVIKNRPEDVKRIIRVNRREDSDQIFKIDTKGIKIETVDLDNFINISGFRKDVVHQNIAAMINPPQYYNVADLVSDIEERRDKVFLMLDGVTDTRNLGAIIRTANASGVEAVILPKDKSAKIDASVYKSSAGAIENIKICIEVNLSRTIEFLKDKYFMVYGLDEDAKYNIYEEKFTTNVCCVIGGEDSGIRRLVRENCDKLLKIPMAPKAHSLNASVAAAVFMYEVYRQHL